MGHDDDRVPFAVELVQEASKSSAPVWLSSAPVGSSAKDDLTAVHQCAGHRNALLLATAEMALGLMAHAVAETEALEQ